mmetsp:Transcript_18540/g.51691  ORF Transcript_18540/g.51691 Transcript_18540/m.51691 type:complete len:202 (+) Transcript_18540:226-831(+)
MATREPGRSSNSPGGRLQPLRLRPETRRAAAFGSSWPAKRCRRWGRSSRPGPEARRTVSQRAGTCRCGYCETSARSSSPRPAPPASAARTRGRPHRCSRLRAMTAPAPLHSRLPQAGPPLPLRRDYGVLHKAKSGCRRRHGRPHRAGLDLLTQPLLTACSRSWRRSSQVPWAASSVPSTRCTPSWMPSSACDCSRKRGVWP